MNNWFDKLRARMRLKGRRRRIRKGKVGIHLTHESDGPYQRIPAHEYPRMVVLPVLDYPRLMAPGATWRKCSMLVMAPDIDLREFIGKYGAANSPYITNVPMLCQMLAKIGHAYAVATASDIDSYELLLTDLIRFGPQDGIPGDLVGSEPEPAAPSDFLHKVILMTQDMGHQTLLVARIRLFACYGGPVYYAVVGRRVTGIQQPATTRGAQPAD